MSQGNILMFFQELLCVLTALSQTFTFIGVPSTTLINDIHFCSDIYQAALYLEMPSPYMISTSACLNGGATLFFTTLIVVRLPNYIIT